MGTYIGPLPMSSSFRCCDSRPPPWQSGLSETAANWCVSKRWARVAVAKFGAGDAHVAFSWAPKSSPRAHLLCFPLKRKKPDLTFLVGRVGVDIALEGLLQWGMPTRIKVQCHSTQFHAAELKTHLLSSMSSRNDIDKPDCEERRRKTIKAQPSGPWSVERNSSSRGNGLFRSGCWTWSQKTGIGVSVLNFLLNVWFCNESCTQRSCRFPLCQMETVKPRIASLYWQVLSLACLILSATREGR